MVVTLFNVGEILENQYLVVENIQGTLEPRLFKIYDIESGKYMVLKCPRVNLTNNSNPQLITTIYEETLKWIELEKHPHITVFYFFKLIHKKIPCIFIEWVGDKTLSEIMEGDFEIDENTSPADLALYHPIVLKDKLSIAIQIANGLSNLHNRGVIHNDFNPRNIIIYDRNDDKEEPIHIAITDFETLVQTDMIKNNSSSNICQTNKSHILQHQKTMDVLSFGNIVYNLFFWGRSPPTNGFFDEEMTRSKSFQTQRKEHIDYLVDILKKQKIQKKDEGSILNSYGDFVKALRGLCDIVLSCNILTRNNKFNSIFETEKALKRVYYEIFEEDYKDIEVSALEKEVEHANKAISFLNLRSLKIGTPEHLSSLYEKALRQMENAQKVSGSKNPFLNYNDKLLEWKENINDTADTDILLLLKEKRLRQIYDDSEINSIAFKYIILETRIYISIGALGAAKAIIENNLCYNFINNKFTNTKEYDYIKSQYFDLKGLIYFGLGIYNKAVKYFIKSIILFEIAVKESMKDIGSNSRSMNNALASIGNWRYIVHLAVAWYNRNGGELSSHIQDLLETTIKLYEAEIRIWLREHMWVRERIKDNDILNIDSLVALFSHMVVPKVTLKRSASHSHFNNILNIGNNSDVSDHVCKCVSNDKKYSAQGFDDGKIIIKEGNHCIRTIFAHNSKVEHVEFSNDNRLLFSIGSFEFGDFTITDISALTDEKKILLHPPIDFVLEKVTPLKTEIENNKKIQEQINQVQDYKKKKQYEEAYRLITSNPVIQKDRRTKEILLEMIKDGNGKRVGRCKFKHLASFEKLQSRNMFSFSSSSQLDDRFTLLLNEEKDKKNKYYIELYDSLFDELLAEFHLDDRYDKYFVEPRDFSLDENNMNHSILFLLNTRYDNPRYNSITQYSQHYGFRLYADSTNGIVKIGDRILNREYSCGLSEYISFVCLSNATFGGEGNKGLEKYILCFNSRILYIFEIDWEWEFSVP